MILRDKVMNKILIGTLLLSSSSVLAQSCPVDVPHPIHIDKGNISVYEQGKPKLLIDKNNEVYINGEKIDLTAMQQKAVEAYSHNVQTYLPQMAQLAQEGVGMATDVLGEVANSFDSQDAFKNVETLIAQFGQQANEKFYNQQGEFVMPADVFSNMDTNWKTEFESAMKQVSVQSIASLFAALSDEMKNGDVDFTQLQSKFSELKARLGEQMAQRSQQMKVKADSLCGSIEGLAEQEKQLQQVIPQLKGIPMFEI
ncbi:chemotaxis protein [Photobacterium sp. GB-27]|nr:chemotaxis protein [Photobacterium sp. GB-56]PSV32624.1 chemotaxis protein [Photobacterium sp. GB-72]PSV38955.1 chemotaxis protein [Photobacterium sp. GB-27]PSV40274.1 chemotaxis protein [Photobacterium sp. GB-210]PSV47279.1 chemotaxis protein [Photobacterium sp. GB-36]PSV54783.1 chemotaxis protein [Photobacterium sp. GB-1]PSV58591.1 chemotaxis protein [Photobacterium sp. GB-3]PSW75062.1 chemotaxis protein [Photobacterium sp. GB-50]